MNLEAVVTKAGEGYVLTPLVSDKGMSVEEFVAYVKGIRNGSAIGLRILSAESVPIPILQAILAGAAENPLIEIIDIRLSFAGRDELVRRQMHIAEQAAADPATHAPEPKSKDKEKSEPQAQDPTR